MKMIFALAALAAVAVAAPAGPEVQVVKETPLDNIGVDGYNFGYQLSNGEEREESGQLQNFGTEKEAIVLRGSFSWIDEKTNQKFTLTYTADENGFHPKGDHLPA